jgi:putative SOS response-associated peptidase YedK
MCGRFTLTINQEELKAHLSTNFNVANFSAVFNLPRFNIAPGQEIIALINDGKNNRVGHLKWGFIPSFAKDEKIGFSMINAKSETLDEKISFRQSFEKRRCLILADSFYEWKRVGKDKTPMRIKFKDGKIFAMAGIWNTYTRPDGQKVHSCAIVTTSANKLIGEIHDRMPVILDKENQAIWINPSSDIKKLKELMKPHDDENMEAYQVSSIVNNAKNDVAECLNQVV